MSHNSTIPPCTARMALTASLLLVARDQGFIVWVDENTIRLADRLTPRNRYRITWRQAECIVARGWWRAERKVAA